MEDSVKNYLNEISDSSEPSYQHLLKFVNRKKLEDGMNKRDSFLNSDDDLGLIPQKNCVGILNVHSQGNSICENKFTEIMHIINHFSEDSFYFLTDAIKSDDLEGVLFDFPTEINWNEFSNGQKYFGETFFSSIVPYNFWLGENWLRQVMAYFDDIYIPKLKKTLNFPSELIVIHQSDFNDIEKLYSYKYGKIISILEYKDFLEPIFENGFKYLLTQNIYITKNSIEYLRSQL
ncbi:hypothetical protein [Epilithonimonas vandammei]|uniref:Uncharacterized protein n=1 Tax=Epilithonimonas vandammei TaxID=2487072 RepID=A0A3G8Y154_9FLAO|nr:hypothetical protein [Epilithonimonas vandammei]AZI39202.1 hypothetical protein EIB74_04170 [Epilithonimonas vandammei]